MQSASVKLFPHGLQAWRNRHGLHVGVLPPGEAVLLRLVADHHPLDAGVALGLGQMFQKLAQTESKFRNRIRPAPQPFDRVVSVSGNRVPSHIGPHLGQEHVHTAALGPIQNHVQHLHLGVRPVKDPLARLIDTLLQFHAAPVHAQPFSVHAQFLPVAHVRGFRIAAPFAA